MSLINIIAILFLGVLFILQITKIICLDMNILGPYLTVFTAVIIFFYGCV